MKIVAYKAYAWFLMQDADGYLLDANCNHSFVGYTFTVRLNRQETAKYLQDGSKFLDWLAHDIHFSAPLANSSNSIYKERRISNELAQQVTETIVEWRAQIKRDEVNR